MKFKLWWLESLVKSKKCRLNHEVPSKFANLSMENQLIWDRQVLLCHQMVSLTREAKCLDRVNRLRLSLTAQKRTLKGIRKWCLDLTSMGQVTRLALTRRDLRLVNEIQIHQAMTRTLWTNLGSLLTIQEPIRPRLEPWQIMWPQKESCKTRACPRSMVRIESNLSRRCLSSRVRLKTKLGKLRRRDQFLIKTKESQRKVRAKVMDQSIKSKMSTAILTTIIALLRLTELRRTNLRQPTRQIGRTLRRSRLELCKSSLELSTKRHLKIKKRPPLNNCQTAKVSKTDLKLLRKFPNFQI